MRSFDSFIAGRWKAPGDNQYFESVEPYSGGAWARIPLSTLADVDEAVVAADTALRGAWASVTASGRGELMFRLAELLDAHSEELANVEARDNGKVLREMLGQAKGLSGWYRYYGGLSDKFGGRTIAADKSDFFIFTDKEPVGVVGAITAWNSPLLLLAYKLAPALAAGCTMVVKPSELASASTLLFAAYFEEAGFPKGVLSVVTGGPEVGNALVSHPLVRMVTFTGSPAVGRSIGKAAASRFAKVSLELGGKSANIVFPDANLEKATNGVIAGIYAAGGQTCVAGSRLLVHDTIADELVARVVARAEAIVLGNPASLETEMGPLIGAEHVRRVHKQVVAAKEAGATIATGGRMRPDLGESFYAPTVIDFVTQNMEIAQTELFGPVLSVLRFTSTDEAMEIANSTQYGLAAGVWTESLVLAHKVARRLIAGTVWINAYRLVSFGVPTNGRKTSGVGVENGIEAIDEYLQPKAVWINLSNATRDPFKIG